MDKDKPVRKYLIWLLESRDAHMSFDKIVEDFPEEYINAIFPNSTYSFWGSLEHIRRTQEDILDFIKNSGYKERSWPEDYWPERGKKASSADWVKTIVGYKKDLEELKKIVVDPAVDLFAELPHGQGQTIFREILLLADHTAYQLGEIATMRRVFGHWDTAHE